MQLSGCEAAVGLRLVIPSKKSSVVAVDIHCDLRSFALRDSEDDERSVDHALDVLRLRIAIDEAPDGSHDPPEKEIPCDIVGPKVEARLFESRREIGTQIAGDGVWMDSLITRWVQDGANPDRVLTDAVQHALRDRCEWTYRVLFCGIDCGLGGAGIDRVLSES